MKVWLWLTYVKIVFSASRYRTVLLHVWYEDTVNRDYDPLSVSRDVDLSIFLLHIPSVLFTIVSGMIDRVHVFSEVEG